MAVAAYASVLSLLRVVDNIQHPSHLRLFPDPTQIDALREKLSFLQEVLEVHSSAINEDVVECMVRKIPRATDDAEVLINNYVVDQLYREFYPDDVEDCNIDPIHDEIHRVIQEIVAINEALTRTTQYDQEQSKVLNKGHSLIISSEEKNKMVGFDDPLKQVLEKLTGNQRDLVIVPIVGMCGIGKTTLARSVFDHPYNLHHFHVRIWLTISQDYTVKKVLQGLLDNGILSDKDDRELSHESEGELITKLHKKLFGQRYLIVLDDVWSTKAWDDLRRGFPDNGKGSRVMVTTRLLDIANSLSSHNNSYSMELLDEDRSWDIFSKKAFEKGGRSPQLEEIGRKISKHCRGLPLMLVVIGGLLANSKMTVEYWQTVAEDINSFASSMTDELCLRILSPSYHHLPIHLKPCFLYMRHFEEDSDIEAFKLIRKWVSEGFVKPVRGKSLEEAAREYLEDLICRNMLLIRQRSRKGNIKICSIHDLLRDLSIKEFNKEQLLEVPKTISVIGPDISGECVICKKRKSDMTTFNSETLGSDSDGGMILVCSSCENVFPKLQRSRFVVAVTINSQNVTLPTTCRWNALYVYPKYSISIFHTLHLFWNLETLEIGSRVIVLPKELWEMPKLRHVEAMSFMLPDPVSTLKNGVTVLENLQTLKTVKQFKFAEEIVQRIQNLRKLCTWYALSSTDIEEEEEDQSCYYLQNLARLQKLESLSIGCMKVSMDFNVIAFPCSLKKLTLVGCKIAWDDLTVIGGSSLPNLQVLKLSWNSVSGKEWIPIDGEFTRLKYLKLEDLDLVHWRVDYETHFPALETLVLKDMEYLKAIPREIGELPSLNSIYLEGFRKNVIDCASLIVEEQHRNGNEGLVLYVKEWCRPIYRIGGSNHV